MPISSFLPLLILQSDRQHIVLCACVCVCVHWSYDNNESVLCWGKERAKWKLVLHNYWWGNGSEDKEVEGAYIIVLPVQASLLHFLLSFRLWCMRPTAVDGLGDGGGKCVSLIEVLPSLTRLVLNEWKQNRWCQSCHYQVKWPIISYHTVTRQNRPFEHVTRDDSFYVV